MILPPKPSALVPSPKRHSHEPKTCFQMRTCDKLDTGAAFATRWHRLDAAFARGGIELDAAFVRGGIELEGEATAATERDPDRG